MAPSKPRNSSFKDAVVAQMSLKAHFAIADNHPTDKSIPELAKLMLLHNPYPAVGSSAWSGEYYEACKDFEKTNEAEMKQNNCSLDQLLTGQTKTSYFTGDNLWKRALECKRIMLNEIHTVFCQDVCPRWPTLPSGTTTLDPLMLELRKILWAKKALELKDGKVKVKDGRVKDAIKQRDAARDEHGLVSPIYLSAEDRLKSAVMELEAVKAEEVPAFETDWFPTLWRSYLVFGPSLDDPHGHGGFLSPQNGGCLTSGPLPDGVPADVQSPNGGRKRARQVALETVKAKDADAEEADGDKTNQKMVAAMEKANALAEDRMRHKNVERQISTIKAMLDESGDLMNDEEKSDLRKQLLMLRKKSLSMAASDDGSG